MSIIPFSLNDIHSESLYRFKAKGRVSHNALHAYPVRLLLYEERIPIQLNTILLEYT